MIRVLYYNSISKAGTDTTSSMRNAELCKLISLEGFSAGYKVQSPRKKPPDRARSGLRHKHVSGKVSKILILLVPMLVPCASSERREVSSRNRAQRGG